MTNLELENLIKNLEAKQEEFNEMIKSSAKDNKALREALSNLEILRRSKIKYENIYGSLVTGTTHASAGTESEFAQH